LYGLRIEGPDRCGLGADVTRAVAGQGINLRGASAAALGKKTVIYLAFDAQADVDAAMKVVKKATKKGKQK